MCVLHSMFTDLDIKQQHSFVILARLTERSPLMAITKEKTRAPESPADRYHHLSTNKLFANPFNWPGLIKTIV